MLCFLHLKENGLNKKQSLSNISKGVTMNQLFLIITLLVISSVSVAVFKLYVFYTPISIPAQTINLETPIINESKVDVVEIPQIIKDLNETNSKIAGLTCDQLHITIREGIFSFSLKGYLRYEKENKFRMIVGSMLAKELDLGSNDQVFWFWSRKNKDPGLFYAKHEDYFKTRLKTPFNPVWIMKSLGIDVINTQDAKIVDEAGKNIMVIQLTKNASGKPIASTTFIDRTTSKIRSIITTDTQGKVLISIEIKEYENNLPRHIVYTWFEENKIMEFKFINPKTGNKSNPKLWEMPNMEQETDMGIE